MKMHDYIRCWGINPTKSAKFIHDTVRQMIYYAYASIRNKASNSVAKAGAGKCDIQKAPVVWLGTHAFHAVLSRKPKAYAQVIKSLAFEMSLPQHRRSRKRFRGLVAQGLAGVSQINF
ncbi:hypothetical protein PLICRDRAFT_116594 [Plicaturopsis crispa FD-325 SS-3]|uniref:RNA-directed DNA polymerase n=1 Tax=Plicaturopsis crispa FD-325 SS-3 TaxID=944288 RepID=A0A0C9TA70_PLICR|nr:hypothetical protein PLICRDRAFT_116594 [Plicaturopsis crispa FD-325 SS-3]